MALDLTGKEHAHTLLRQSVRFCCDEEDNVKKHFANDPLRTLLPDLLVPPENERDHWLRVFLLLFGRASFVLTDAQGRSFHLLALDEGRTWESEVAGDLSLPRGDQAGTGPTIRMTDKAGVATRGGRSPTGVTTLATARS